MADYSNKMERAFELENTPGHPLHTFSRENQVLKGLLEVAKKLLRDEKTIELTAKLEQLRDVAIHYAKKGDLLYPHLKVEYEISGPSDLMWTSDDEIRDELTALLKVGVQGTDWVERVWKLIGSLEEMIIKEERVLFPICAVNFTEEEWIGIYRDSKDYPVCFGVESQGWEKGERSAVRGTEFLDGEVIMPGGHMTLEQLTALLNILPMEITFIDDKNRNCYFNEGPKVFKRPRMAIDREVFSCHPPKIEAQVRRILEEFRNGTKDQVPLWMEKNGRIMTVTYMAVRDKSGKYLGAVELVQDMEHAREYFTDK